MARPEGLNTKILLDGCDPKVTEQTVCMLGFLDGQTTNPTLLKKNPDIQAYLESGKRFTRPELNVRYRDFIERIDPFIPEDGSISIEVYADKRTTTAEMVDEGHEFNTWTKKAYIKLPATEPGFRAAHYLTRENIRVNITLGCSPEQAARTYQETLGAKEGDVFFSSFIGRFDDRGINGISLIRNTLTLLEKGDGHLQVLGASIRNLKHLLALFQLETPLSTSPFPVLKEWGEAGMPLPDANFKYQPEGLSNLPYRNLDLNDPRKLTSVKHMLTMEGQDQFALDYNSMILKNALGS